MVALAVHDHGLDVLGQGIEKDFDAEDGGVVEGVALLRPGQPQDGDVALPLGRQRGRQLGKGFRDLDGFAMPDSCGVRPGRSSGWLCSTISAMAAGFPLPAHGER